MSVTVLHGRQPDPVLVKVLRELLADAEAGTLAALVGVADYHEGEPDYIHAGIIDAWAMRGRLSDLGIDITTSDDD